VSCIRITPLNAGDNSSPLIFIHGWLYASGMLPVPYDYFIFSVIIAFPSKKKQNPGDQGEVTKETKLKGLINLPGS